MYPNRRLISRRITGAIILLGIALSFAAGHFSLPLFCVIVAFAILIGALVSLNLRRIYSGIGGFVWMLILALFFLTHSWIWFLVGAVISIILGPLLRSILVVLLGIGLFRLLTNKQSSPVYQPPQQSYQPYGYGYPPQQPSYQPYQQGYRPPASQLDATQHGGTFYYPPDPSVPDSQEPSYSSQADMPQAQYPQMPPME